MKKKILAVWIIAMMLSALMPQAALAATHTVADGETLNIGTGVLTHGDSTTETLTISEDDIISVDAGAEATITGSKNVEIDCGAGVTLTLDDVTSDVSGCALSFTGGGNTLTLAGTNTLKSGSLEPGVRVEGTTVLEIEGGGSLEAIGGDRGAGIGSGYESDGGDITIVSGNVTATGGDYGAGIGGGYSGDGGDITIVSGNVTATGSGAGIGGGYSGDGGDITIVSGNVTATGGGLGAGIGGGGNGAGGSINISGGTVIAGGGGNGAGIGGGDQGGGGGTITINGTADVTTTGGASGAGIGGGNRSAGGTITIEGTAEVTATGGSEAAGIGGGNFGSGGRITISGGIVYANGQKRNNWAGAGIGGGSYSSGGVINITGGTITAGGDGGSAGIGGGDEGAGGSINISGGTVIAEGGDSGAGIGGGCESDGGTITINGTADVTATGGVDSAGIGGGSGSSGGTINISGGIVYAIKDAGGTYDIGPGTVGSAGTISISGTAAVFLGTNSFHPSPVTTHTHCSFTEDTEEAYGIPVPAEWEPTFGAYLPLYSLDYDANGGNGTVPASVTEKLAGEKVTVESGDGLTREDYIFSGWNTAANGSGTDYAPGDEFTFTEDTTLYAQWTTLCDLNYDANGGSGTVPASITDQLAGEKVTVGSGDGLTREHCIFGGWNTAADGSGTDYAPGDEFTFTEDTTLYAQWTMLCDLNYDANGGRGTVPASVTDQLPGEKVTVGSGDGLTREHYKFGGWNTAADGSGTAYAPGDEFTFTEDTTLYAHWTMQYILQYNANDGSGTPPPSETEWSDIGVTGTVVKNAKGLRYAGHVFDGWNTAANGSGTAYDPGDDFTYTGVTTLYAQWRTPVKWVRIGSTSKTMGIGDTATLRATVSPNAGVTWKSSDKSIVTVSEKGKVTAKNYGIATVSAEVDGEFDTCTIVVVKTDVAGVRLSSTSKTMGIGDTATLIATVTPGDATDADIMWKSTDASVATVSQSGKVTAVAEGAAAITAEADGQFAVCAVLVSSGPGDGGDEPEDDTEPSPASTATASPQPTGESGDTPDTGDSPAPTEQAAKTIIITIVVSDLPEGTAAIELPNGEVVELDGSGTIQVQMDASDIGDDGSVELIALDEEGVPLATSTVTAEDMQAVDTDTGGGIWKVLLWVFIGLAGLGGAGATVYLLWRKGQRA